MITEPSPRPEVAVVDVFTAGFRAMGCGVEVLVHGGGAELLDMARRRIEHYERCWTRFDASSDLCRINAAGGRDVVVDPSTVTLVQAMVRGWVATDGTFDPTLLAPLVGLGYGASWDDATRATPLAADTAARTLPTAVLVDEQASVVRAPAGIGLDAGGIGKGLAADLVVAELLATGAAGALVSIGGDVCVQGLAPQEGGWSIGVADPHDDRIEQCRLRLVAGGVATSGTAQRAWTTADGRAVHHLLDPATGQPPMRAAIDAAVEATVVAGTAAWAEVWTKAVLVRGPRTALPMLDSLGLAARAVLADGHELCNDTWAGYVVARSEEDRS
jgi:thiamine biosynthesis lipoprotein